MGIIIIIIAVLLQLHGIVLLLEMIVSFAYRNPRAGVSKVFDIFNSRNVMKTAIVQVALLYSWAPHGQIQPTRAEKYLGKKF